MKRVLIGMVLFVGLALPVRAAGLEEFKPLAEQGDAMAQYYLGFMYFEGLGVPKNDAEAVKWYRKAADQGIARAQYELGLMYFRGLGVPRDRAEAYFWWTLAAARGYRKASEWLKKAAGLLTPDQRAAARSRAENWRPFCPNRMLLSRPASRLAFSLA